MAVPSDWKRMSLAKRLDRLADMVFCNSGLGAKNGSTVTDTSYILGPFVWTKLDLLATPITVADDAGTAQYGGVKIYDFPAGVIYFLGAIVDCTITMGATGTFIDAWSGVFALGSATAGTGSTLTSTEATFLKSVAIGAATAKVGTAQGMNVATQVTESGASWYDGHSTAADLYFNLAIADDASHTAGTGTITGSVDFIWANLGDY
jgi:hypothetical protein